MPEDLVHAAMSVSRTTNPKTRAEHRYTIVVRLQLFVRVAVKIYIEPTAKIAFEVAVYRFTAIACTSNRALKSNVPAPRNARAGYSFVKNVR